MSRITEAQREEARETLRAALKPGQTVYTVLRHASRSGMSRSISVIAVAEDGSLRDWTWAAGKALGWPIDTKNDGVEVAGCGMDAGFHLVYALGSCLWPNGTQQPHGSRNGQPDTSGGYALKHRWL